MSDYSYIVGPVKGNMQSVTIMNKYSGAGQTVISTPEKVDEYVKKMNKAPMQDEFVGLGVTALGGGLGYLAGMLAKAKEGGIIGAGIGLLAGLLAIICIPGKQERLTKEFLKNNPQGE